MLRAIGNTGIQVYPVGLGAMPMSIQGRPAEKTAIEVIRAALDAGVTLIDTANSYCTDTHDVGHNERLIAKALTQLGAAKRVTVATKGGLIRPRGAWNVDAKPESLIAACEQSLRDLGVETITLYQLHAPDDRVPWEDSVGAMARLKQDGKIQHVGLSNVNEDEVRAAQKIVRVESVQNRCNISDPEDVKTGLVAFCGKQGMAYLPYSPVGGHFGHKSLAKHRVLQPIAKAHGRSPQQVMLAWLLAKGPHVLPIPGASKATSITDSAAAVNVKLSAAEIQQLEQK